MGDDEEQGRESGELEPEEESTEVAEPAAEEQTDAQDAQNNDSALEARTDAILAMTDEDEVGDAYEAIMDELEAAGREDLLDKIDNHYRDLTTAD